jgi:hypothetical protein
MAARCNLFGKGRGRFIRPFSLREEVMPKSIARTCSTRFAGNVAACFLFVASAWAGDYPIAGLAPYQRPQGAPAIASERNVEKTQAAGLYGISSPIPRSLGFLTSQGAWYTPFIHPGMTGRYDLRGWHKPSDGR